jgi:16S rRNA (guanine527-N7)-methyltransferase
MFHVKHFLEESLKELKIETNNKKTEKLLLYLEELMRWNKKINLISRKLKKEEVFKKLLVPSLIPCGIIKQREKILDFGAGGGIASIPLKIFKEGITLHLLESKEKPVAFLEYISFLLDLNLKIIKTFVRKKEDIEEQYDWVFVRAVTLKQVPKGLAAKVLYYGKYPGDAFSLTEELSFKGNTISVLV